MTGIVTLVPRPPSPAPAPRPPHPATRRLRWAGEVVVTLGVVVALFAGYEVWVTNLITAGRQADASAQLTRAWAVPPVAAADGDPVLRLFLPSLGGGFSRTVVEGTGTEDLATGPGQYSGSAAPGEVGDLAIAGHRTTHGAPFRRLGELRSCAPVVAETRSGWAVYRVLPMADEATGWASGRGTVPECAGLAPVDAAIPGREFVAPSDVEVIDPVPNHPGVPAAVSMITLTTCDPPFSARQRMVVHGLLDRFVPKTPGGGLPIELAAAGDL